jgi:hypothetical protein
MLCRFAQLGQHLPQFFSDLVEARRLQRTARDKALRITVGCSAGIGLWALARGSLAGALASPERADARSKPASPGTCKHLGAKRERA